MNHSPQHHLSHVHHNHHVSHEEGMHGGQAAKDFLRRFGVVSFLLAPLFVFSMIGQTLFGYPDFTLRPYIELGLVTIIFWLGFVFFEHAKHELKSGNLGMMTLVSIAVGSGYLFSVAATFIPALETEFNLEISSLIWVLLFGHYLEAKSSSAAGNALDEVAKLLPKQAHVKHGDMVHDMDIETLNNGDIVLIKPGEKAPADGLIIKGRSRFNEAHISGESKPVEKTVGARVVAGAIAEDGSVEVKLDKVGSNSTIGQIQQLIASAKQTKPAAQRLADQAASILTVTAVTVALLSLIVWSLLLAHPLAFSITIAITILVIACPHALGLAIPTVSTIATRKAVSHGIFIKDLGKLEVIRKATFVIFDKTGTLTQGMFGVSDVLAFRDYAPDKMLAIAASLEQSSSHVIGSSIVSYAKSKSIGLSEPEAFTSIAGKGIQAKLNNHTFLVGNETLVSDKKLLTLDQKAQAQKLIEGGKTVVFVADDKEVIGIIGLSDQIKPEAKSAIDDLHHIGLKVAMITGDNDGVAQSVAKQLEIDEYFANVLPQDKYTHVKTLQSQGNVVLMVGDGVNDAPALTQADAGIAIGAGADVAVEAGDVVLTRSNPADIPALVVLSRKVYRKMYENLWWALGYNVVAIPAAAGLFIPFGIRLNPQVGAIAMALSSVIVVINALTLRNVSLVVKR